MNLRKFGVTVFGTLVLLSATAGSVLADEIERARGYFTNLELVNQDGETVRFFDDVLKDKVVVINFIFTNCGGACPISRSISLKIFRSDGGNFTPSRTEKLSPWACPGP